MRGPRIGFFNGRPEDEFERLFCTPCPAYCCRKNVRLPLMKEEFKKMIELARKLQRDVVVSIENVEGQPVWVMSHTPEPCGFLDQETNLCLIYEDRPQFCREFYCDPKQHFKLGSQPWRAAFGQG